MAVGAQNTTRADDDSAGPHPPQNGLRAQDARADASSWDGVIARLQADGFTAIAAPNPLRGLAVDSSYLADFLSSIQGPIVLVGHSYGGMVITKAPPGNPHVKALRYLDAFLPPPHQTPFRLPRAQPPSLLRSAHAVPSLS